MVGTRYGNQVKVPWHNFALGWDYITNKLVDKSGAEKHVDGYVRDYAELDFDS